MGVKVVKFGGSSLADATQFAKVKSIIKSDPARAYVVPSAPGKRCDNDKKVTDMLYACYKQASAGEDCIKLLNEIKMRYLEIASDLKLDTPIDKAFERIEEDLQHGASVEYMASRGEYLCGMLLADYLGYAFIDATDVILFNEDGSFNAEATNIILSRHLKNLTHAVIPGFYGSYPDGRIHTFTRGGSDISGAIVARAAGAELYENWTDVCGFLMVDPHVVPSAVEIANITYKELRELSYMGARVLHEDSVFPVHRAGIPTNIRNTNLPEHPGTMIQVNPLENEQNPYTITGIAGKRGFTVISIEKAMMNAELGFGKRVLQVLEENRISFEHLPTGIDTLCVIVSTETLAPCRETVISRIVELTEPDTISIQDGLALVSTVGRGMVRNCGTAAKLFGAMSHAGVNVRMIDQGSSELSIIVGVNDCDMETTMRAIYSEFVK